ncbi:MAG: alpha amylase C-terminal domain-containing protein, partial [Chlamydiia bacterium]|nr:alpha amylase C-terminal domain-containing protein [Chlamydiia bacterium]
LDRYHIDGLRVDAVSSMLYLNYSRKDGEWIPNEFGGHENLEAIALFKELNESIFQKFPDVLMIAEESTAWPGVSQPTYLGGLGFSLKWNMGWMHDTLRYFSKDPIHRKYHHNEILFSMHYAFHENFLLPLSHDEVVHGKGSLFNKMPGDEWQRMANLRLLYGYQYTHPGKKLLFMGAELAQISEWNHDGTLEWHLLDCEKHLQLQHWLKTLNHFYRQHPALYEDDFTEKGFSWNHIHDYENSILSYVRRENSGKKLLIVCNFTPVPRQQYAMGLPEQGCYHLKLNSDDQHFGGSGYPVKEVIESAEFSLPPLSLLIYEKE